MEKRYCPLGEDKGKMKITYEQAKEVAINITENLGCALDVTGYVSGGHWSIDDYVFEITAGGKFRFEVHGDFVGEGFPR